VGGHRRADLREILMPRGMIDAWRISARRSLCERQDTRYDKNERKEPIRYAASYHPSSTFHFKLHFY
jgi:hypothetical protein